MHKTVVLDLSRHMCHLFKKIYPMDRFVVLTPYIIYCTVKVTIFRNVLSVICGSLCRPLEIPGGPPVAHLDHVENQNNCHEGTHISLK